MNRKEIVAKAFNLIAEHDDTPDNEQHSFTDAANTLSLEAIALNVADLTDKVAELTAYMQGFMEWTREPKG